MFKQLRKCIQSYLGITPIQDILIKNNLKLNKIMATIRELSEKVDALQAALDAEQEQIAQAIAELQQTVEELRAIVADGGTEEERQTLSDKLDAVIADLQATIAEDTTTTSTTESTETTTTTETTPPEA